MTSSDDTLPSYASTNITATCHCGGINILAPHPPSTITECKCTICLRYGVIWAYYPLSKCLITAEVDTSTTKYIRSDFEKGSNGNAAFHFCSKCGCMIYADRTDMGSPDRKIGVNVRLMKPETWEDVERKVVEGPQAKK